MDTNQPKAKILIIDDTPLNLDILFSALAERYTVIAARDGTKALELAQRGPLPDLILLDVMMPGIDGYEVCRRLKAQPETCHIPVLFLTALSDEANELKGLELGAADYIHKPISIPLVQARVATHLELGAVRRQLAAQVEQLVEAARLRDEIDQIMRHDLKTPLTPVLWLSSIMRNDSNLTEVQQQRLELIHNSGLKMLEMINNSLDLYKMEVGRYRYKPCAVDLPALAQRAIADLAVHAAAYEVRLELDSHALAVNGDELLCYSLLGNLIKNAIEASPAGSAVRIDVAAQQGRAVLRIHNVGTVPEQLREHFFDKFTTAGKEGGTGLGTYSARLMAETMGGSIAMVSSDTSGTTLTVWLPLQMDSATALAPC